MREIPRLCMYLRAKVSTGPHGDARALADAAKDASTVFWCLLTQSPAGPDDQLVHAGQCGPGRACCVERDPSPETRS
jgi:hypothetical protein